MEGGQGCDLRGEDTHRNSVLIGGGEVAARRSAPDLASRRVKPVTCAGPGWIEDRHPCCYTSSTGESRRRCEREGGEMGTARWRGGRRRGARGRRGLAPSALGFREGIGPDCRRGLVLANREQPTFSQSLTWAPGNPPSAGWPPLAHDPTRHSLLTRS